MTGPTTVQGNKVQAATEAAATVQETPVEVNEHGFMTNPSEWAPGAALYLARHQGLRGWPRELLSDHWRVIDFMRTYHEATGNAPSLRYTCRALGMTRKQFSRLFPGGMMTVRRISGLPGPRKSANREEVSLAQRLLTRDWWEKLTSVELSDDGAGRMIRRLSASAIAGQFSRGIRGAGGSGGRGKERTLSSAQRLHTGDWWARLTGD